MLMPSIFRDNFVDDLFDSFFAAPSRYTTRSQRAVSMNADVKEFDDHYEINLQLPGYTKEDIKADLSDGYLTINASHKEENKQDNEDGKYIRRECYYGQLQRSFYVGDQVEQEDIRAAFENGILKLAVAKKEAKPQVEQKKYIPIEG